MKARNKILSNIKVKHIILDFGSVNNIDIQGVYSFLQVQKVTTLF